MQKSKKMMVSLCGLALSSLFVLNNKSVVHADTVSDNNQNNAISWNSDSDAAQNAQNTQKADDDQQNAAQPMQSRAEMSTVRSSSEAPRTTNQNTAVQSPRVANVQDAQKTSPVVINNPANNKVHVHYIDANGNAVKNSSHDDDYDYDYDDDGSYDYDIDAAKTGQGSYIVPSGYSLNNPDGKYTVSGAAFNGTNIYATVDSHVDHIKTTSTGEEEVEVDKEHDGSGSDVVPDPTDSEVEQALSTSATSKPGFTITNINVVDRVEAGGIDPAGLGVVEFTCDVTYEYDKYTNVTTYVQHLPVAFVESNNSVIGMIQNYSGKVGTTQNVNLTLPTGYKLADGQTMPTSVTFANNTNPLLIKVTSNGQTNSVQNPKDNKIHVQFRDQSTGAVIGKGEDIDLSSLHDGVHYYNVPAGFASDTKGIYSTRNVIGEAKSCLFTDNYHMISGDTVTVPVHRTNRFTFSDNSGNVKSVNGNTVNVVLIKPQSVNPSNDTRCHSQATRTIQINFPDGQIPQSYDGIVDKSGKLVQTVYFTRTATEDALTGNILQYGNWTSDNQDPNFIGFPERTLPRIPGYTLSIKPAAANA